jgi:hypothetical protein
MRAHAPQQVDQAVDGDNLAHVEQEDRQDGALLERTEVDWSKSSASPRSPAGAEE